MAAEPLVSFDARLYRAALRLCPGEFRREHGGEMACDFDDAVSEVASTSGSAVWALRFVLGVDVARTIVVQWLRTGLPAIGGAALVVSLGLSAGLASVAQLMTARIRSHPIQSEPVAFVLLIAVAVMVIVTTIVFNLWANRPRRIGRRR